MTVNPPVTDVSDYGALNLDGATTVT